MAFLSVLIIIILEIGLKTILMNILIQNEWFRTISIKNCTYYFFDDIVIIKNLDPNEIKIDEKS